MANQTKKHLKHHGTKRNGGKMAEKSDSSKHAKCAPKKFIYLLKNESLKRINGGIKLSGKKFSKKIISKGALFWTP